ncbi:MULTISPECIES: hypothetical protein [unclassified Bradyrhizobium]|uniref:hypothetical protein n=1 Tax=unclassified Bradyrhizobium TaxID=2631580 RepID=UPI001FFBD2A0|nr:MULTISPECIES: hypothetical protein [unclassified Bradyrhizobium]
MAKTLLASDEVVLEATANSMAVSRVLASFVARVIITNPLQVKAIAQAHVRQDRCWHARQSAGGRVSAADLDA